MELLNVENLCKVYGKGENEVRAVDGVSFSVPKGQMVAIIGASGSGKSTLLHMIGAVDRPTSGKIFLDGQDVFQQNNRELAIFRRRQVGLIYQFYNLIPVLTAEENIVAAAGCDKQAARRWLEAVELGKRFDSEEAASFINGILGAYLRSTDTDEESLRTDGADLPEGEKASPAAES